MADWLSIDETAELTRCSRATINRRRADPDFPLPFAVGGRVYFVREDVVAWMAKKQNAPRRQRIHRDIGDKVAA